MRRHVVVAQRGRPTAQLTELAAVTSTGWEVTIDPALTA
jgi:hypothetical protein